MELFFYFVQNWNLVLALIQPICTSKESSLSARKQGLIQQQNANFNASFVFKGIKKYENMIVMSI